MIVTTHIISATDLFLKGLDEQRKVLSMCDVTLKVEGRNFQAHRSVLAAASPYFKVMFGGNFREHNENIINLQGAVTAEGLDVLLDTIYTTRLRLTTENIADVTATADYLQMDKILHLCNKFLSEHMSVTTCAEYFQVASKVNLNKVATKAKQLILWFFKLVNRSTGFRNLDYEYVLEIISADELHLNGQEIEVFRAICTWVKDKEMTEEQVDAMLTSSKYIQYTSIPKKLLKEEILMHELISNDLRREPIKNALTFHNASYRQPNLLKANWKMRGILCYASIAIKQAKYKDSKRSSRPRLMFYGVPEGYMYEIKDVKFNVALEPGTVSCVTYGKSFIFTFGILSTSKTCIMLRYNTSLGTWLRLEAPPVKQRIECIMMTHSTNTIYVMGGADSQGRRVDSCFEYTIEGNTWKSIPRMPAKLSSAGICSHSSGMVYIAGGDTGCLFTQHKVNTLYAYDTKKKKWYIEAPMYHKRSVFNLVEAYGHLYAISGVSCTAAKRYKPIEEYSIALDQWTSVELDHGSIGHLPERVASCIVDDKIVVIGGFPRWLWSGDDCLIEWCPKKQIRLLELNTYLDYNVFGTVTVPL